MDGHSGLFREHAGQQQRSSAGAYPERDMRALALRSSATDTCAMLIALIVAVSGPMALTALGQWRRGQGMLVASLAGLFFPVAWTVWYLRDEHPYRAGAHRF